jgi:hypothetical protein
MWRETRFFARTHQPNHRHRLSLARFVNTCPFRRNVGALARASRLAISTNAQLDADPIARDGCIFGYIGAWLWRFFGVTACGDRQ